MKKKILLIALIAAVIGLFIFSLSYRNAKISQQTSVSPQATSEMSEQQGTTVAGTEKGKKENVILAEDKESGYCLYYDGETVTIKRGEYERKFTSWTYSVDTETPEIFCKDYDGDGETELLVKLVSGKLNESEESDVKYTYVIHIYKPYITQSGEKTFTSYVVTDDTWKIPFEQAIKCEMTQLKSCKKFLQLSMDDNKEKINYDEKTGITKDGHTYYAKALCDNKKQYYTLSRWSKGVGNYGIDKDGTITLDIQVLVNYEEVSNTQYVGNIHCEVGIIKGNINLVPNSIVFIPLDEFKTVDPRDTAKNKWNCVISNKSTNTNFESKSIDWIEAEFSLKNTADTDTQYFEKLPSKIKCVDTVKFTQGYVVLTAKEGYTFSQHIADRGDFEVIINSGNKNESDISYNCSIKNENNVSTMTIYFDKTYDKINFDNVKINFGV